MPMSDPIVGGIKLIRQAIQSLNYLAGSQGWTINLDGSAEFNNVTIRGTLVITGTNAILFYTSTPPAAGTILFALSALAGSDAFGNTWSPGFTMFDGAHATTVFNMGSNTGVSLANPQAVVGFNFTINGVPVQIESASFNGGAPALLEAVHGLVTAGKDTAVLSGPSATAPSDPAASRIALYLTEGAANDGADGRIVFVDSGGTTVLIQMVNGKVTVDVPFAVNDRETITSSNNAGALTIFQNTPTTTNPGTIAQQESAAGNGAYGVFVSGDSHARMVWDSNGRFRWGPGGAGGLDNIFGRIASNLMGFAASLLIGGTTALGDNGVGTLQLANATTVPTTNPTGGLDLYAKNGIPQVRDPGGQLLAMVRSYTQDATSDLLNFTVETDVPGATISVVVTGSNSTVEVKAQFDMQMNTSAGTLVGFLSWNGADRTEQAVFTVPTAGTRMCIHRGWEITGVTAGTYTAKLRASCTAAGAANGVRTLHTGLIVDVKEG